MPPDDFLPFAHAIGRRLTRGALWREGHCTWTIVAPDLAAPDRPRGRRVDADGNLYQGTAGIALFLGELHHRTADPALLPTALGAIAHALDRGAALPPRACGFHLGRVGIAYAAVRLAALLERPDLAAAAAALLEPLAGREAEDEALDVIAGAAGAIPALLAMAPAIAAPPPARLAQALGDHLIARAHQEPRGWSWPTGAPHRVRNLCGLAHGAAGCALALLELDRATGDGRYRFAAEMAFLYERRRFDPAAGAWPDLRRSELDAWYVGARWSELAAAARAGTLPPRQPSFFNAWCHGAGGIGLSRLRAWELTGQALYRREAEIALRAARRDLESRPEFSLCHGRAGLGELLLCGARTLAMPELEEACRELAAAGCRRYEQPGACWPSGNAEGGYEPSLMLGEAGIGHFLLRLAAPEVPALLVLQPPLRRPPPADPDGFAALARSSVETFFSASCAALELLGEPTSGLLAARLRPVPLLEAPAERAHRRLCRRIASRPPERRTLLADAFAADRQRYEQALRLDDFSVEFLRSVERGSLTGGEWRTARLRLAPGCRLLATDHDWDTWLRTAPRPGTRPPPCRTYQVLFVAGNRVERQPLGRFAATLLHLAGEPATLAEMTERVSAALGAIAGDPSAAEPLRAKVADQVHQLFAAGWLDLAPGPAGAAPLAPG
jgi:lantibiotic biosynthesis protein